ncbi:Vacuolar fusion protein MON1 A [Tetrabaena socialis]|uniref:Vacuolar fusion protein MON1 homolog n=1 Tax=Tetrabaena socialis TaxID=47790 RepID=A0A2J8AGL1_9CHLO|nr:Vacuolar fusion protein MON1 A [Tetrabaena socialis]|eukprot:PNH11647.1 Vacuolar fusion protein MON1 A [Tetrabaena socialis]
MDPDEPLLESVSFERSAGSGSASGSRRRSDAPAAVSTAAGADAAGDYIDEGEGEDDDDEASVGRGEAGAEDEEDEPSAEAPEATPLPPAGARTAPASDVNDETVQSIEAAVASLALQQQQHPVLLRQPSFTATAAPPQPAGAEHGHGEAFSPVCLPHYNSDAFLHAYIHYLDASSGLYLVLLAGSAEAFHQLSAGRALFEEQVAVRGLMPRLRMLRVPEHASSSGGGAGGRFGHTPLWSYALRFTCLHQLVASPPCPLHRTPAAAAHLAACLAQLHSLLHSPAAPGRPNKLAWFADARCVLVAARDRDMELYAVCDPLTDKATAAGLLEALRRHFGDRGIAADVTLAAAGAAGV